MKAFADVFRAKNEKELASLQRAANVVGKDDPEKWDKFVINKIAELLQKDEDLMEKFLDVAFTDLAAELAIKPDPDYKPTKEDELLAALGVLVKTILK